MRVLEYKALMQVELNSIAVCAAALRDQGAAQILPFMIYLSSVLCEIMLLASWWMCEAVGTSPSYT